MQEKFEEKLKDHKNKPAQLSLDAENKINQEFESNTCNNNELSIFKPFIKRLTLFRPHLLRTDGSPHLLADSAISVRPHVLPAVRLPEVGQQPDKEVSLLSQTDRVFGRELVALKPDLRVYQQ